MKKYFAKKIDGTYFEFSIFKNELNNMYSIVNLYESTIDKCMYKTPEMALDSIKNNSTIVNFVRIQEGDNEINKILKV